MKHQGADYYTSSKYGRILQLYTRLLNGEAIDRRQEAEKYEITDRTIQRDIEDIRTFLKIMSEEGGEKIELVCNRKLKTYYFRGDKYAKLTDAELEFIFKLILGCGCICKEELSNILRKVISHLANTDEALRSINKLIPDIAEDDENTDGLFTMKLFSKLCDKINREQSLKITYTAPDNKIYTKLVMAKEITFSKGAFFLIIENSPLETEMVNLAQIKSIEL